MFKYAHSYFYKSPSFRAVTIFCLGYCLALYVAIGSIVDSGAGFEPACILFCWFFHAHTLPENHYFYRVLPLKKTVMKKFVVFAFDATDVKDIEKWLNEKPEYTIRHVHVLNDWIYYTLELQALRHEL